MACRRIAHKENNRSIPMQHMSDSSLFHPDSNCRETAQASHAAMAIDCANYYHALYEAIVNARHSIFVVGWDIDSRIKLLRGDHGKGASHPARFFELIQWKAAQNPDVQIYLNRWDFSLFMARDRELLGKYRWYRHSPPNLHYFQDGTVPTGACHHQKIVTVDDEVAFCGGMDVALRRWDERQHMPHNHNRIDPAGENGTAERFNPYHDIQMLVAGEAAQALARLARQRWEYATGSVPVALRPLPQRDSLPPAWPESLTPDFTNIPLAISQTLPVWDKMQGEHHVERMYLDMIGRAERFIYMENQFFCRLSIAEAMNRRLKECPALQVLLVSSYNPNGMMERKSMWHGRVRFRDALEAGGVADRVVLAYPVSRVGSAEKPVRIHSKLMVVDDRYLRVGSSNINNRSMRMDTECDLILAAQNEGDRRSVAAIRNDLIREHTGYETGEIEAVAQGKTSVQRVLHYLGHSRQHLYKIDDEHYRHECCTAVATRIADPEKPLLPIGVSMAIAKMKFFRLFLVVAAIAALALVWKVTPLAHYATPENVIPLLEQVRNTPWAVPLAMLIYTVGTLAFFPHMAMTGIIVIVFSPIQAFSIAMFGSLVSGSIGYWAGRKLGLKSMRALIGETAEKISIYAKRGGIVGITLLRLLPIAPYTAVNLALGMLEISFFTFLSGTFLGTLPGTVIAAFLGESMLELWQNPDMEHLGVILAGLTCWIAIIGGSHYAAKRWKARRGRPA